LYLHRNGKMFESYDIASQLLVVVVQSCISAKKDVSTRSFEYYVRFLRENARRLHNHLKTEVQSVLHGIQGDSYSLSQLNQRQDHLILVQVTILVHILWRRLLPASVFQDPLKKVLNSLTVYLLGHVLFFSGLS